MDFHLDKIKIGLVAAIFIYALIFLFMPLKSNCDQLQSAPWHDTYTLEIYAGAAIILILSIILKYSKKISSREVVLVLLAMVIYVFFMNTYYYSDSVISACSGTVLSDNWWQALNWINNNTAECSVVATYWDPGHFITGIAKRSVVFDGATQGSTRTIPSTEPNVGMVIEKDDKGINRILIYKNNSVTSARIQDISTTLFTGNETLAVEILNHYKKPNCTEMYYIASSDLIGKSTWWTYFSTWNPLDAPTFGQRYNYAIVNLAGAKPLVDQNAVAYTYDLGQNTAFLIYEVNNTLRPFLQQQGNLGRVEKLYYFDRQGNTHLFNDPSADIKGEIWLDPSRQTLVFIPPELEDSIFTRMFLFNGEGLQNFQLVNSWGGEVKLFKVNLPS